MFVIIISTAPELISGYTHPCMLVPIFGIHHTPNNMLLDEALITRLAFGEHPFLVIDRIEERAAVALVALAGGEEGDTKGELRAASQDFRGARLDDLVAHCDMGAGRGGEGEAKEAQ